MKYAPFLSCLSPVACNSDDSTPTRNGSGSDTEWLTGLVALHDEIGVNDGITEVG
ncbi:MAG: hypothetical protein OER22_11005 [Gammaproteobacteria bacterium]|nr:hypothetical protein [Gammaproteobacteria bacterium]MDH3373519.1 hypothetical protein [Gammaproteobacteria bacterium]MDH3553132.1 hypothetical protein [Gammaproteobacteria bacterium]